MVVHVAVTLEASHAVASHRTLAINVEQKVMNRLPARSSVFRSVSDTQKQTISEPPHCTLNHNVPQIFT